MGKLRDMFLIWLASHGSRRNIYRKHKGNRELYLVRYHLFRSRWLNIHLHNFFLSDEEDLHDHPFHSISIILRGSYIEHHHDGKHTTRLAGDIWCRGARELHRIVLWAPGTTWSLFIHGRRTREWGFLREIGPSGLAGWEAADNSTHKRLTGVLFPRFEK